MLATYNISSYFYKPFEYLLWPNSNLVNTYFNTTVIASFLLKLFESYVFCTYYYVLKIYYYCIFRNLSKYLHTRFQQSITRKPIFSLLCLTSRLNNLFKLCCHQKSYLSKYKYTKQNYYKDSVCRKYYNN